MDKTQKYRNYMVERYLYLYENSEFLYTYFMREETEEEKEKYKELSKQGGDLNNFYKLNLKLLNPYTLYMIESVIFEDKPLDETEGYIYIEDLREKEDTEERIRERKKIKKDYDKTHLKGIHNFDVLDLLFEVYENIARQTNDHDNKLDKLSIIDEYIRIAKYTNDERTWKGGYHLEVIDEMFQNVDFRLKRSWVDLTPNRASYDVGIKNNELINISKNIKFSKEDKKKIYFICNPDEMEYNIRLRCENNNIGINRPKYSKFCNGEFRLEKENIFYKKNNNKHTFLTLCPYCLSILKVNLNLIPKKIQTEIMVENKKDPNIFLKKYTESKLKALKRRYNFSF